MGVELLTSDDMAKIFRASSGKNFVHRFARDRLLPMEQRMYPDPINPNSMRGRAYLWDAELVRAFVQGERPAKRGRK